MKIYNTLTRQKEKFIPVEQGKVKMYVCGPTVYNSIHIGNLRPFITFDIVRRYFEYKGYAVTFVQNYTDIDDKIIDKANAEGVTAKEIAERYINEIEEDVKNLGVHKATCNPRATEEIPEMITMIQLLIEKGFAYEVNGTVYFETHCSKNYGQLSKKNIEDLEAGARVEVDLTKRNSTDFVLWKPKKEGEPSWESPWGAGRPGWHIECSAMAKKYLGETIDIHCGGTDLVFPHHENEIAQSEAANGKQFAKYWMHNGFINVDNKKMSKSLNNFFTVKDIVKDYPYEVVRFFMLNAHYRSPVNFSRELMESAANGLKRIQTGIDNLEFLSGKSKLETLRADEKILVKGLTMYKEKFETAMEDDFNIADAVASIFELIRMANTELSVDNSVEYINDVRTQLKEFCDIIGVDMAHSTGILNDEIEALIAKRQQARRDKDFALSDKIRDDLMKQGVLLEDTRDGVKYRKV